MPLIQPLSPKEVTEEAAEILNDIGEAFGFIPDLFATLAHHPALLQANWDKVKAVMMGGVLRRSVKEAIALLISTDNRCAYCINAHTGALEAMGTDAATIEQILTDQLEASGYSDLEAALIRFARAAGQNAGQIPESLRSTLKEQHPTTIEVVEALGTMELFVAFNRFIDSLGIAPDNPPH